MGAEGGKITWIGHATALIELAGQRILIDPLGRRRCRAIGHYDAVLITHAHIDHLNRWTLKSLDRGAELFVPQGAAHVVADLGFRSVREVEPGDQLAIGRADLICVPTKHDPGRWRKGDGAICTGYVLAGGGKQIHHAGDIDYSTFDVFEDIGRQFDLDATLLPIGGLLPVWYYRWRRKHLDRGVHIDPDTALHIADRLGARSFVPVHWGTVNYRLGPPSMPARRLIKIARQQKALDRVRLLAHGEEMSMARPALTEGEMLDQSNGSAPGQRKAGPDSE